MTSTALANPDDARNVNSRRQPFQVDRALSLVAQAVVLAAIATPWLGCYRPSIDNGKLGCTTGGQCPEGHTCLAGLCWKYGTGPEGGVPDADDAATPEDQTIPGPDVQAVDTGPCPAPTRPQCAPGPPALCDPVCQSGDCNWCTEKCTIGTNGNPICAGRGPRMSPASCTIFNSGAASQHDDCITGEICLNPVIGSGFSFCFPLCRSSTDCPGGVACGPRLVAPSTTGTASVCDPPYSKCDPALPTTSCCDPIGLTGCDNGRFCYLVSPDIGTGDSRTVCEYSSGGIVRNACTSSRDCMPEYGCSKDGFCQRVCDDAHPCQNNAICSHDGSGVQYGYCPP